MRKRRLPLHQLTTTKLVHLILLGSITTLFLVEDCYKLGSQVCLPQYNPLPMIVRKKNRFALFASLFRLCFRQKTGKKNWYGNPHIFSRQFYYIFVSLPQVIMQKIETTKPGKSVLPTLFFRFFAFYFMLYILPFPAKYLPYIHRLSNWYSTLFNKLTSIVGKYVFHIPFPLIETTNGSGDATYNYVRLFVTAILAIAITIAWTVWKRAGRHSVTIARFLLLYISLYLGFIMVRYGLIKVIKSQFPFPYSSLNETYGNSSPMRLMWSFMGYSPVYNIIMGVVEILAGLFLLLKRTRLLGALFTIGIMSNVVLLNFCYDVPVKLYALHVFLMAVFIALPYGKQLAAFFFTKSPAEIPVTWVRFANARTNRVWFALKMAVFATIIYSLVDNSWQKYIVRGDGSFLRTPLFGLYNVQTFVKNGDTLPPLITDTVRWRMLNITAPKHATVRMMNDDMNQYHFTTDTLTKLMRFYRVANKRQTATFDYSVRDSGTLIISGMLHGDSIAMILQKQDVNKLELLKRKFHWVNEAPYNK